MSEDHSSNKTIHHNNSDLFVIIYDIKFLMFKFGKRNSDEVIAHSRRELMDMGRGNFDHDHIGNFHQLGTC